MIRRGIGVQSFVSAGGGTDADAQAFITAAGITDATQQSAINTLVTDLKTYGIWSKMKAIWPFVGGTSSSHKWNLKDPRDLDAAFRLVFSGGITHSSTGVLFGGVNGYADTKLNPSGLLNANNISISTYLRTNTNGVHCDIGAGPSNTTQYQYAIYARLSDVTYTDLGSQSAGRITYANTDSRGHFISTRTSSTSFKAFKNSTLKATLTTTQSQSLFSKIIFIGAMNESAIGQYSNRECAFASIGDGLTDTEAANFYTAVQAYQTTLSRNV